MLCYVMTHLEFCSPDASIVEDDGSVAETRGLLDKVQGITLLTAACKCTLGTHAIIKGSNIGSVHINSKTGICL